MPFLQALSEKYVEEPHGDDAHEIVVLGSVGNVQVEAVGLDKVRSRLSRLDRLKVVSLDGTLVAFPDTRGKIRETCPSTLTTPHSIPRRQLMHKLMIRYSRFGSVLYACFILGKRRSYCLRASLTPAALSQVGIVPPSFLNRAVY
jgi:hypothetical protein